MFVWLSDLVSTGAAFASYIFISGSKSDASQGTLPFFRNVKLQVAVLRACGLKAAAKLKATLLDDSDLNYSAEVGLNSFVKIQTSFLPSKVGRCGIRNTAGLETL